MLLMRSAQNALTRTVHNLSHAAWAWLNPIDLLKTGTTNTPTKQHVLMAPGVPPEDCEIDRANELKSTLLIVVSDYDTMGLTDQEPDRQDPDDDIAALRNEIQLHTQRSSVSSQSSSLGSRLLDYKRNSRSSNRSSVSSGSHSEVTIKMYVMGAAKVGKTTMVSQFLWNVFVEHYVPTVEECNWIEFELSPPLEGLVTLQVIDTAGNGDFPTMHDLYCQQAEVVMLVFSVTDPASWEYAKNTYERLKAENPKQPTVMLVGNKTDLRDEDEELYDVPIHEISHFAASNRLAYTLLSARERDMVQHVFRQLLCTHGLSDVAMSAKKRRQSVPDAAAVKRGSCAFDPADFERIQQAYELQQKHRVKNCALM